MIKTIQLGGVAHDRHPRAVMAEWLVSEGDRVSVGAEVFRYEIDKAAQTGRSRVQGVLCRILVTPGMTFSPDEALAMVADSPDEDLPEDYPLAANPVDPDDFDWSEVDEGDGPPQPLAAMRQTIARRMAMSKRFIPCFYLTAVVDMTGCIELRQELRQKGEKATYNDMAVKAAALALANNPKVAGVYTPAGFQPRRRINIGFAAALPDDGLVVPVVKDADRKRLVEISAETRDLAAKAKRGELAPEDCAGGVFSVSYLGAFEVDEFVAIVNPGESGILAASKVVEKPVAVAGEVVIRPVMKITLSYDHRSIDGALGARFAGEVKALLEKPGDLL